MTLNASFQQKLVERKNAKKKIKNFFLFEQKKVFNFLLEQKKVFNLLLPKWKQKDAESNKMKLSAHS